MPHHQVIVTGNAMNTRTLRAKRLLKKMECLIALESYTLAFETFQLINPNITMSSISLGNKLVEINLDRHKDMIT